MMWRHSLKGLSKKLFHRWFFGFCNLM